MLQALPRACSQVLPMPTPFTGIIKWSGMSGIGCGVQELRGGLSFWDLLRSEFSNPRKKIQHLWGPMDTGLIAEWATLA